MDWEIFLLCDLVFVKSDLILIVLVEELRIKRSFHPFSLNDTFTSFLPLFASSVALRKQLGQCSCKKTLLLLPVLKDKMDDNKLTNAFSMLTFLFFYSFQSLVYSMKVSGFFPTINQLRIARKNDEIYIARKVNFMVFVFFSFLPFSILLEVYFSRIKRRWEIFFSFHHYSL